MGMDAARRVGAACFTHPARLFAAMPATPFVALTAAGVSGCQRGSWRARGPADARRSRWQHVALMPSGAGGRGTRCGSRASPGSPTDILQFCE